MENLMQSHKIAVAAIQKQVVDFRSKGVQVRIYHGSTNSTRPQNIDTTKVIDTSSLNRVLEVNTQEKYILVEPNVPMDALIEATLPFSLIPPVVMEFPGITVGGGIQGGAGESSSFKWGLFHESAFEYEMVLGNGECIIVSDQQHSDLFHQTACSYGTLGIITRIKLRLIESKPFISVTYKKTTTHKDTLVSLSTAIKSPADFVEGIQFSKNLGVIITGSLQNSEQVPPTTQRFLRPLDPWFYMHAKNVTSQSNTYTEYVPIRDYIFRYDRGAFWVGEYALGRYFIPNIPLIRKQLNSILKTRKLYKILHATGISQQYIVQDISVPSTKAEALIDFIEKDLAVYPLWLCPIKPSFDTLFFPNKTKAEMVINVGIYGKKIYRKYKEFLAQNRAIEQKTLAYAGHKVLYAHVYSPEEEFWQSYDKVRYMELRKKYSAENIFPDIYQKVSVKGYVKPMVLKGLYTLLQKKFTGDRKK